MILREDVLDDTGESADIESVRLIGRMFQEQLRLQAWFRSIKTADIDVVLQALAQLEYHTMEFQKRYAPDDTAEGRALKANEISSQFDIDRIYNLREPLWCLDFATPRLFLVLPADLNSWNDNDVTTHNFRLYFLCDFKYRRECDYKTRTFITQSKIQPRHIHLSSHPGYDLLQPREFFHKFGHFALEMLRIIKEGYLDQECEVPALSSFGILKTCDGTTVQHSLSQEDLGQMVDKSIAYIQQQHSVSSGCGSVIVVLEKLWNFVRNRWTQRNQPSIWINGPKTRQIQSFLRLPEHDNGMGGLFHTLYPFHDTPARWLCLGHTFEHSNMDGIDILIWSKGGQVDAKDATTITQHWRADLEKGGDILQGARTDRHEWHFDFQLGTISVSLETREHTSRFTEYLKNTKRTFDVTIHFAWEPSRPEFKFFLEELVECNVRMLEIDTSNLEFLRHSPMEYTRDLFVEYVEQALARPGLFVILRGQPQESQMYLYLGLSGSMVYGFQFDRIFDRHDVDWWEIQKELYKYHRDLTRIPLGPKELSVKFTELSRIVEPLVFLGLQGVDVYSLITGFWELRFGVQDGAIDGIVAITNSLSVQITDAVHPPLQRMAIQHNLPEIVEVLFQTMDSNPTIRQIDVPTQEREIYEMLETIGRRWHGGPNSLEVTVYEQGLNRVGRKLTTAVISKATGAIADDIKINIKKWDCGYISRVLLDWDAKILEALARDHPDALESFTLNVSLLKEAGLTSICHVLRQSTLSHLTVECTNFDTASEAHLGQVLDSVPWSTIKSLKLRGHNIDAWIKLWAHHTNLNELLSENYQLLRLHVVGWGMADQELSHESAVWLHNIIYSLSPVDVQLQNIQIVEPGDQELIRSVVGGPTPEGLSLVNRNVL